MCFDSFQTFKIPKTCRICDKTFKVEPSQDHRYSTCENPICRQENKVGENNPNWRGGKKRLENSITGSIRKLHKYTVWKRKVLEENGEACCICGTKENLQVHHIHFAQYHPWHMIEPTNGIVLCMKHHQNLHRISLQEGESIAVDLDGTLAMDYEGEFDPEFIGEPVPVMLSRVKNWLESGKTVKIFTARAHDSRNIPPIAKWLEKHGIGGLEITNRKTPDMKAIWDDKARSVVINTGRSPEQEMFSLFKQLESDTEK